MRETLTIREAAFLVGVSVSTVYRWIESGRLSSSLTSDRILVVSTSDLLSVEAVVRRGRPRGSK